MKKRLITLVLAAALIIGTFTVSAAEVEDTRISNMDATTYIELRSTQIQEALEDETITEEQAALLLAHIQEVAKTGEFGQGMRNTRNTECVLGEDGNLGIFRNENAGMRNGNGNGNGVGSKTKDGTGNSNGKGNGNGRGNR